MFDTNDHTDDPPEEEEGADASFVVNDIKLEGCQGSHVGNLYKREYNGPILSVQNLIAIQNPTGYQFLLGGGSSSSGLPGQDTVVLNEFVDRVIGLAGDAIREAGENSVPLPDFNENFDTGGFIRITGNFRTSGGRFGDLSSLRRTGNVVVESSGDGMTLSAEMGLGRAYVHANRYWLTVNKVGMNLDGTLDVRIGQNSASAKVNVVRNPADGNYRADLVFARIDRLEDLAVSVTGLGILNSLTGRIASWVAGMLKDDIRVMMNGILESAIRQALENFDVNETIRSLVTLQILPPPDPSPITYTLNALRFIYNTIFD